MAATRGGVGAATSSAVCQWAMEERATTSAMVMKMIAYHTTDT